jgi:A/G-specific adenine glycosylase
MLQQTQVARVLPHYEAWTRRWPGVCDLAAASPADVIRGWAGLGYNRRALNLHRTACVLSLRGAPVPVSPEALRELPGVGSYTAAAVASFAGGIAVPVVDTNVARVLARATFGEPSPKAVAPAPLRKAAASLLPRGGESARHHNLALMDLGATVCTARSPRCEVCPLRSSCAWLAAGRPLASEPVRGVAVRFEDTARFARGRIVAALRAGALDEERLGALLPSAHAARLAEYLAGLAAEGLIVAGAHDAWALAGDQGNSSIASPNE